MSTTPIWIKDPLAILADGAARGIVIRDSRIVELVAAGAEPATPGAVAYDASAHVVIPGLINTHHHFYQTLTRALPAAMDRELFPWLKALYPVWAKLTPESLDAAVTLAMAELMLSGCTTTTDHHYVFPAGLEDAVGIEVAAARRLGIRVLLTRGSMNLSERDGGLPPDRVVQDEDTILADSERVVAAYHERGPDAMVQIALAPCSPFSVTGSLMQKTAALADKLDVRLHTHLAETEDENRFCEEMFGCRPLDYLEQNGWLGPRTWLAHGIFFNAEEMKRLGKAKTTISHCACSNQLLASGCCPVCEMEEAGVGIGLGVDGSASNDGSNLMQEVRSAFLLQRARYGVGRISHKDALRWATKGSAACVGRLELGEIAVGKAADLALFKLDELRFSGAGDPIAALVLCGAHRADRVMVGGRWTVVDGAIPGLDIAGLISRHSAAAKTMRGG
ncbi:MULTISPECIES: 8-oxoguanine deaminase [unclassified Bradyrhizobium]|uniref:8-oxoguanine deaminase n=1 Tax=unclassified Bradyrhizobium TaxID=2631580 RepID=UPI0028E803D1|nr:MULTISPECIES: 8-oxoguanine deaminase [unclassified Bradyrhizobium]